MIKVGAMAIFLMMAANPAHAGWWCADGPGRQPDHPCDDDSDDANAAAAKFEDQWMAQYPGITDVSSGLSDDGDYLELRVTVDPPELASSIEAVLPSEADGFPVRVLAQPRFDGNSEDYSEALNSDVKDDAKRRDEIDARAKYKLIREVLSDPEAKSWMELPGVVVVDSPRCGSGNSPTIQVEVQPAMVSDAKAQIPSSLMGVPVEVVPFAARPVY